MSRTPVGDILIMDVDPVETVRQEPSLSEVKQCTVLMLGNAKSKTKKCVEVVAVGTSRSNLDRPLKDLCIYSTSSYGKLRFEF